MEMRLRVQWRRKGRRRLDKKKKNVIEEKKVKRWVLSAGVVIDAIGI